MTKFEPRDVGEFHSDAFRRLEEVYGGKSSDEKTLTTRHNDFSNIISSYCDEGSEALCELGMDWAKEKIKRHLARSDPHSIAKTGRFPVTYPRGMHSDLRASLENVFLTIDHLDPHNVEEIADTISKIEEEIEAMEHVDPAHQKMALSATSVAIESTNLWHGVYYNEDHPLRARHHDDDGADKRRLQASIEGIGDLYGSGTMIIEDFFNLFTVCNNGLSFIIGGDIAGVLLTPVSIFMGIPTAYVTWIIGVGVVMFTVITSVETVMNLVLSFGIYSALPFLIPFAMVGLPTTLLSYTAFSLMQGCGDVTGANSTTTVNV